MNPPEAGIILRGTTPLSDPTLSDSSHSTPSSLSSVWTRQIQGDSGSGMGVLGDLSLPQGMVGCRSTRKDGREPPPTPLQLSPG